MYLEITDKDGITTSVQPILSFWIATNVHWLTTSGSREGTISVFFVKLRKTTNPDCTGRVWTQLTDTSTRVEWCEVLRFAKMRSQVIIMVRKQFNTNCTNWRLSTLHAISKIVLPRSSHLALIWHHFAIAVLSFYHFCFKRIRKVADILT